MRSVSLASALCAAVLVVAACGSGDDASNALEDASDSAAAAESTADVGGSSLPAGCNDETPLELAIDGVPEISGSFAVAGGVALPFAVLPGDGPLVDLSDEELAAAVDASDLRGYAVAATDFDFGPEDTGGFYSFFSTPTLPEEGGTTLLLTVIPPDDALAAGDVIEVGTPLSYEDDLQTTAVSTGVFIETNVVDAPFLGGVPTDFSGSVEVVALTDDAICLKWDTSSPVMGGEAMFATVTGTVSAPLLPLSPRNSMG